MIAFFQNVVCFNLLDRGRVSLFGKRAQITARKVVYKFN